MPASVAHAVQPRWLVPNRAAFSCLLLFACETDSGGNPVDASTLRDAQLLDARSADAKVPDAQPSDGSGPDARASEYASCPGATLFSDDARQCLRDADCEPLKRCSRDGLELAACPPVVDFCQRDDECPGQICEKLLHRCAIRQCREPCTATSCSAAERCNGRICEPLSCVARPSRCGLEERCEQTDAGAACVPPSCTRSSDCSCGSCVNGLCNPKPGLCVYGAR